MSDLQHLLHRDLIILVWMAFRLILQLDWIENMEEMLHLAH